jgi:hypothetical protein
MEEPPAGEADTADHETDDGGAERGPGCVKECGEHWSP